MIAIEHFLGKTVELPEDLRYHIKQGLWARKTDNSIVFGLSQPALVLLGGFKDMEWLVNDGEEVSPGDTVLFAITTKILYIDVPLGGAIGFNTAAREHPEKIISDPYGDGWIFSVRAPGECENAYLSLASADAYVDSLRKTDGFRNAKGLKGGVSGMCKAVYSGINSQKLS